MMTRSCRALGCGLRAAGGVEMGEWTLLQAYSVEEGGGGAVGAAARTEHMSAVEERLRSFSHSRTRLWEITSSCGGGMQELS